MPPPGGPWPQARRSAAMAVSDKAIEADWLVTFVVRDEPGAALHAPRAATTQEMEPAEQCADVPHQLKRKWLGDRRENRHPQTGAGAQSGPAAI